MEVKPGDLLTLEMLVSQRHVEFNDFERQPRKNEIYVVCRDMSCQSTGDPNRIIKWRLEIDVENDIAYIRNPQRHEVRLVHVGTLPALMIPDGVEMSVTQMGSITETDAEYGEEVTSNEDFEILPMDPTPLDIAKALSNAEQVVVMNKFLQGSISYAEMRALCG